MYFLIPLYIYCLLRDLYQARYATIFLDLSTIFLPCRVLAKVLPVHRSTEQQSDSPLFLNYTCWYRVYIFEHCPLISSTLLRPFQVLHARIFAMPSIPHSSTPQLYSRCTIIRHNVVSIYNSRRGLQLGASGLLPRQHQSQTHRLRHCQRRKRRGLLR